jgi:hypothetical protein
VLLLARFAPNRGIADSAEAPVDVRTLMQLGERDAVLGKPIGSFYAIPDIDHSEEARMEYEKAYWGTLAELSREGH